MKKFLKVICFALVMVLLLAPLTSFAATSSFSAYTGTGKSASTVTKVQNISSTIFSIMQAVGIGVAVIMIVVVGIQWMMATPNKKAELKGKLWSMAIGVVLLFGGVAILGALKSVAETTTTGL